MGPFRHPSMGGCGNLVGLNICKVICLGRDRLDWDKIEQLYH